jgi:hypothetical protein
VVSESTRQIKKQNKNQKKGGALARCQGLHHILSGAELPVRVLVVIHAHCSGERLLSEQILMTTDHDSHHQSSVMLSDDDWGWVTMSSCFFATAWLELQSTVSLRSRAPQKRISTAAGTLGFWFFSATITAEPLKKYFDIPIASENEQKQAS